MAEPIWLDEALPELAGHRGPALSIDAEWVPAGPLIPERLPGARDAAVVLLVRGLVVRRTTLEDGSSCELLGAGALLFPPASGEQSEGGLPGFQVRYEALGTSCVAVVDQDLMRKLADRPELVGALLAGRGHQDVERAAMHAVGRLVGVDRRLLALFGLLAARYGQRTPEGVAVPIAIPHRLLAELVGARRPTVTTALRELRESGRLRPLQDGTWMLAERTDTRGRTDGRFARRH
jgi:CRP/FNR family transcriptional regulator, cyclic AMP receptor protein